MNEEQRAQMDRIVGEVMEQMAFMFARRTDAKDETEAGAGGPPEELHFVRARMLFRGPMNGALTLVAPTAMCAELSANILGLDPNDDLAQAGAIDALKEILNVICGHVLTSLIGENPCVEMAPPVAENLTQDQWNSLELSEDTLCFSVDEHPMLLQLDMEAMAHDHSCANC